MNRILPLLFALLLAGCGGETPPIKDACDALRVMLRPELVSTMREAGKFDLPAADAPCPYAYPIEVNSGGRTVMKFHDTNTATVEKPTPTTATIETCTGWLVNPTIEGGTEAEQALALVNLLRQLRGGQLDTTHWASCKHRFPVQIKLNGEPIFEIEEVDGGQIGLVEPATTATTEAPPTTTMPQVGPPVDERFRGEMVPLGATSTTTTPPPNAETGELQ